MARGAWRRPHEDEKCLVQHANKAKSADRKYNLSPPGTTGPIERRLCEFGPVAHLVFGWFGALLSASLRLARLVTGAP